MKRVFVAVAVMVTAALSGGFAHAAWLSADGSGSAQATATSVGGGNTPTASASGSSVTVSWAASTLAGGTAVSGYQVKRYAALGEALQTTGAGCSGTVTTLTCTETGVAVGSWKYSVTPIRDNWTGAESSKSSAVTVAPAVADTTAPTATITFAANGGVYNATAFNAGCSANPSNLCGTASDATGVQSVKVSILRSSSPSRYWNPTTSAFDSNSEILATATLGSALSTSTNWRLPIALSTDSDYTIRVQAEDTLGNKQTGSTSAATATFTYDNTAATVAIAQLKASAGNKNNAAKVTVSGTSSDVASPAQVTVVICKTSAFPCSAGDTLQTLTSGVGGGNGSWSVEATGLTAGTAVYARASHTDTAGNTGTSSVAGPETVLE